MHTYPSLSSYLFPHGSSSAASVSSDALHLSLLDAFSRSRRHAEVALAEGAELSRRRQELWAEQQGAKDTGSKGTRDTPTEKDQGA